MTRLFSISYVGGPEPDYRYLLQTELPGYTHLRVRRPTAEELQAYAAELLAKWVNNRYTTTTEEQHG